MNERVQAGDGTITYVDDRGPTDFADQIEALVDDGFATVHVPVSVGSEVVVHTAHLTPIAARTSTNTPPADVVKALQIADPEGDA